MAKETPTIKAVEDLEEKKLKKEQPTDEERIEQLGEVVDPPVGPRDQRIAGPPGSIFEGFDRTYTQRQLSFFATAQFGQIVTKALRQAMQDGVTIEELQGLINTNNESGTIDLFVRALLALTEHAPEILKKVYMLSLGVPRHERDVVSEILDMPHEDDGTGGLSNKDGLDILRVFVAQNARELRDFFVNELPTLWTQISREMSLVSQTQE